MSVGAAGLPRAQKDKTKSYRGRREKKGRPGREEENCKRKGTGTS